MDRSGMIDVVRADVQSLNYLCRDVQRPSQSYSVFRRNSGLPFCTQLPGVGSVLTPDACRPVNTLLAPEIQPRLS